MTIVFIHWPGNTEIVLHDDHGVLDRFWTASATFQIDAERTPINVKEMFDSFEASSLPPCVEGSWSKFHPAMQRYNRKHKENPVT